ncbi:MAG TPA: SIMPL domain-containing protein [Paludibacteraceae bacterium]|nr:SIMPL domain-containing protein [Paludibacteraceae bacterium]HQB69119.1 SIMPL domain-containing protein [Paludibacteraceae bacterium]HRS68115.1 SIMPL domain-containing protein [Paludibacteraceae bacterium]
MKHSIIEATILAVGFIILGFLLKASVDNLSKRDRYVSVKGLSEMEFPADKVTCPLVFKEIGDDLLTIHTNINTKNATIVTFLKSKGIDEKDITIAAPEIIDLQAERYGVERPPYRYNVTSVITITSSDVPKIKALITQQSELLKKGIAIISGDYRYQINYEFTKLNNVKPQMIEEATKNARAAAEKFALDSDSKLGKIKKANQGQFSITDRDSNTPDIKRVRVVTTVDYYLED